MNLLDLDDDVLSVVLSFTIPDERFKIGRVNNRLQRILSKLLDWKSINNSDLETIIKNGDINSLIYFDSLVPIGSNELMGDLKVRGIKKASQYGYFCSITYIFSRLSSINASLVLDILYGACLKGDRDRMRYSLALCTTFPRHERREIPRYSFYYLAKGGHIDIINSWWIKKFKKEDQSVIKSSIICGLIRGGHLDKVPTGDPLLHGAGFYDVDGLMAAIKSGDINLVSKLSAERLALACKDAIKIALKKGFINIAKFIIRYIKDQAELVESDYFELLYNSRNMEITQYMLEIGYPASDGLLSARDIATINFLLQNGAKWSDLSSLTSYEKMELIRSVCECGNVELLKYYLSLGFYEKCTIIKCGTVAVAQYIYQKYPETLEINSAADYACDKDLLDVIQYLMTVESLNASLLIKRTRHKGSYKVARFLHELILIGKSFVDI